MAPMNDLINENMPRLKAFIDALGEVCVPCLSHGGVPFVGCVMGVPPLLPMGACRLGRVLGCVMGVCTCWEYG